MILETDEGIEGFGLTTSYTKIDPLVDALTSGLADFFIIGADPLSPEQIYNNIFSTTWKRISFERGWSREAIVRLSAAIDIACWDIIGKKAGLPLYKLMGGVASRGPLLRDLRILPGRKRSRRFAMKWSG